MSGETVRKKNLQFTLLCREISGSLGRYLALFAIVALGVGFFSGLKICKPRMLETGIQYLENQNFYDFKAVSEIGFGEKEVEAFRNADFTAQAEGAYSLELLYVDEKGSDGVAKAHSLTKEINKVSLTAGRMPEKSGECLADARYSAEEDLGKTFTLSENNSEATQGALAHTEFTVVGLVYSPLYLNYERGSTALGKGRVDCFLYLLPEEFLSDSYTEVYLTVNQEAQAYSEDYKKEIEGFRIQAESLEKALVDQRKEELVFLYRSVLLSFGLSPEQAEAAVLPERLQSPQAYLLDRNTNVGYVCFENDASIVEGISRVFPAFFFLVAALVCATTMTRMVNDHRTRIGTLKALGYGNSSISGLYLLYAGSAALFGAILGYFLGTSLIPTIIWKVYEIMYGRFSALLPVFDGVLLLVSLVAALLCSVGTAYVCCRTELRENPASLIRPKTPKAGKKIFLERLRPLWRKMSFLHKVSARNILRYKKRLFMMIIGIGGCTALLLTGFGIRDSISDLADEQYEKITVYDYSVSFSSALEGEERKAFEEQCAKAISKILYLSESSGDCSVGEVTKSVYLIVPEETGEAFENFISLMDEEGKLSFPGPGEAVICEKLAEDTGLAVGDTFVLRNGESKEAALRVSGICRNYVYSYVYISPETFESAYGAEPEYRTAYILAPEGLDGDEGGALLLSDSHVLSVSVTANTRSRIQKILSNLNYIVLLVIVCAGLLALIVLYDLTNINITERQREIATIKVLGFFPKESTSYVFRENRVLTLLGALTGLLMGYFLHSFVMGQIKVDMICFHVHIAPCSYGAALIFTFIFEFLVHLFMRRKIQAIPMAESLKSVE